MVGGADWLLAHWLEVARDSLQEVSCDGKWRVFPTLEKVIIEQPTEHEIYVTVHDG